MEVSINRMVLIVYSYWYKGLIGVFYGNNGCYGVMVESMETAGLNGVFYGASGCNGVFYGDTGWNGVFHVYNG